MIIMIYEDFDDFGRFWTTKNKAKQSQSQLAPSSAVGFNTNLKKQSQFVSGIYGACIYMKGFYGNKPP